MTAIQDIHRAETIAYVLGLVRGLHESETARVAIYASQPYAIALETIARDRAFRVEQLVRAIEAGLYDQLDAESDAEGNGCSCGCAWDGAIRDCFCGQNCKCDTLGECPACDTKSEA